MKCPHCEYKDGWDSELLESVKGDDGEFFTLPVEMTRNCIHYKKESIQLFACPKCHKTFVSF